MTHHDNPAGRLYAVLGKIKGTDRNTAFQDAWPKVLNINADDRPELLRCMAHVLALPAQAKAALESVPNVNLDTHLRWYAPICDYLARATLLNATPGSAGAEISGETLFSLEVCSDVLHDRLPDSAVTDTQLKGISGLINELKAAVDAARDDGSLDSALDKFLSELIGALAHGVTDFPLRGTEALADAYDLFFGRVVRNPHAAQKVQRDHPKVWDRMNRAFAALAVAVTLVSNGVQLEQDIAHAIEGPSKPAITTVVVVEPGASGTSGASASNAEESNNADQGAHPESHG